MEEPKTNISDEKDREWFENQLAWWLELSAGENEMACRKELCLFPAKKYVLPFVYRCNEPYV